jgi:nicotinate-nucleotide adenylyltransferase
MINKYSHLEPDVIFFGGTFDPPHLGHADCIDIVKAEFPASKIIVLPSFAPPVSSTSLKSPSAPFLDRLAMSVVAFDDRENVEVSSAEEELETPSYTVNTLEYFKSVYPSSRLFWLLGADQLQSFPSWKEPQKILEKAGLIVLPRPNVSQVDIMMQASQVASTLGFKHSTDQSHGVVLIDGAQPIFVIDKAPRNVASRDLRLRLRRHDMLALAEVSPAVADYIKDIGIYQSSEGIDE